MDILCRICNTCLFCRIPDFARYRFIDIQFFGSNQVYVFGVLGLIAAMSLYLSYNFAYVNKDLKTQLENVKSLSEKALEQERIAAGLELERRLIEAENARQSKELESARELQLSLLPKKYRRFRVWKLPFICKLQQKWGATITISSRRKTGRLQLQSVMLPGTDLKPETW